MANNCFYDMNILGEKEDVAHMIKLLKGGYDNLQLSRIFSAEVYDGLDPKKEGTFVPGKDGIYYSKVSGDCAWSVQVCMTDRKSSYYNDELADSSITLLTRTTLQRESELHNLQLEVFSEEEGEGFTEHYLYFCGKEIINECEDLPTINPWDYKDAAEMNKICGTEYDQDEFEERVENRWTFRAPLTYEFQESMF